MTNGFIDYRNRTNTSFRHPHYRLGCLCNRVWLWHQDIQRRYVNPSLFSPSADPPAIAVDDDGLPVGSILEAAHLSGFKTGLVVTSRITHATPACYSAHVLNRDSETEIAAQQIGYTHPLGSVVDILMGGGRGQFLPREEGGSRSDGVNLIDWATGKGWTYAADKSDFDDSQEDGKLPLPFLGLFESSHMAYELDRNPEDEPSLLEMVEVSLATLESVSADSAKGYFIMIEASRIDHAGHANDIAGHVHDTLMYNEVMAFLKEFINEHPDTQMLSAADHECGGLTLEDGYDPKVISQAQYSSEYLASLFDDYEGDDAATYLEETLLPLYGLTTATSDDIAMFLSINENDGSSAMSTAIVLAFALEAGVNWSTGGHTAADVMLHGFAEGEVRLAEMKRLMGTNQENTVLPTYIEKVLGLNMSDATAALRKDGVDWVEKRHLLDSIKREANMAAKEHAHEHKH